MGYPRFGWEKGNCFFKLLLFLQPKNSLYISSAGHFVYLNLGDIKWFVVVSEIVFVSKGMLSNNTAVTSVLFNKNKWKDKAFFSRNRTSEL